MNGTSLWRELMTTPDDVLERADIETLAARHGQPVDLARFWRNVWLGRMGR